MTFDSLHHPYASRRQCVYARNGMVATSQSLAAQAGLQVLQKGGNAVDAAIATATALTVVEPMANGIGGDAFALVWTGGKLYGLNASGPAPALLSLEGMAAAGLTQMPLYGLAPVTVPGAPSAWAAMSGRFGRLPLTEVMAPAIAYAEQGYPVSPVNGRAWQRAFANYRAHVGSAPALATWFETFAPGGRPPAIGELWRSPDHAATLRQIAESGAEAFYRGPLSEQIDAFSRRHGGFIRQADLAAFAPEWVEPLGVSYRGYDVWEIPPNGHGMVALMALNILKGFDLGERDTVLSYHRVIEALKLAFIDGRRYIADPRYMKVSVADLLSEAYASERRRQIGETALLPAPGQPGRGGTVYLATADGEGNMVSMIQSNYHGFGSGVVIPGTGISLHNRGTGFSTDPALENCVAPGKKPYHTIIPGFLTRGGEAVGPFGVMGGYMQPQGHLQVVTNLVDFGLHPQAALDAPRWQWLEGRSIEVEPKTPEHIFDGLRRRGHEIHWESGRHTFGRGQIIQRLQSGVLVGGTEPRADGAVAAW